MARKIVIASGKGGAVKSSLAAGLGGALAGMGKHILLIDCDIGLRSLDLILGCAENTVYDWADVLLGRCAPEKAPLSVGGLHLLAAPLRDTPAFTPGAMHSLTAQYDAFFDDILIDAPAGIERGFRLAASAAQEAVVVSTPDAVCVRSAAAAVDALYAMDIAPIHLIINRFKAQPVSKRQLLNIDQVIDSAGARLLGIVPDDPNVTYRAAMGKPVPFDCPAGSAYLRIAKRIEGEKIPLKHLDKM